MYLMVGGFVLLKLVTTPLGMGGSVFLDEPDSFNTHFTLVSRVNECKDGIFPMGHPMFLYVISFEFS